MIITISQAFEMYLESGVEEVMSFEGYFGNSFLDNLCERGYTIIDD